MATKISRPPNGRNGAPRRFYPLDLPFSYQVIERGHVIERGFGDTTEISSTQIRVKPQPNLCLAATEVVMSIAWPAKLKDGTGLQFVVLAKMCRYGGGFAEFIILKYEFRTVSKATTGVGLRATFGAGAACGILHGRRYDASMQLVAQSGPRAQSVAAAYGG
jgi:hypothetical protein